MRQHAATSVQPGGSATSASEGAAPPACPVCQSPGTHYLMAVAGYGYWRCPHCQARFMDPHQRPDRQAEYERYCEHDNRVDDPRYRRFLAKLADPLLERLAPRRRGLDYGCGPGPALAAMLEEAGHEVALYDPFFYPDPAPLSRRYDFITCTETAEHFHRPAAELERLDALLRPGGILAIMTCFQTDDDHFAGWHYRRDPTHVVFYRAATLHTLAGRFGWSCEIPVKDVALMHKPEGGPGPPPLGAGGAATPARGARTTPGRKVDHDER